MKKKMVQSESHSDDPNSTQQVVYRKGQPTATPILIYEDSRREVVQQCIANLMSTFHLYPHSEVSPVLLPKGLRICCVGVGQSTMQLTCCGTTNSKYVCVSIIRTTRKYKRLHSRLTV